jgi:HK97 family phage portal protein
MKRFLDLFRFRTSSSDAKATDANAWTRASMRVMDGGSGVAPQPFSYEAAVRQYASWIYAAASINATAVASTPLRLYVRSDPSTRKLWNTRRASRKSVAWLRGDAARNPSAYVLRKAAQMGNDFEEVTDDHPLLRLLSVSNPYHNGHDLSVLRVVWQELTGNAYLHVVTGQMGVPSELWAMPPQWVEIIRDTERFIAGYRYGASSESRITLAPEEVIHFRRPNPRDLWYGMGKLEAAWGAANANAALHEMDFSTFANHARPDWLLTVKGDAPADELDRIETSIQNKLRGPRKTGNFLVTTAEIDMKPLQFPPKDLTGRSEIVEEIAAVFGVPVSMLRANDPNLASATVGYASWREMTVLPLCRMDEETLNQRLLPLFGLEGEAVLAYDDPVPANRAQDLQETQVSVAGGWLTPNEARERNGLDPNPDPMADRLLVNGTPLGGPTAPPMPPLGLSAPMDTPAAPVAPAAPEPPAAPSQNAAHVWFVDDPATKGTKSEVCVSRKISQLISEGYPTDQAAAIAYEYCGETKALEDIDTVPPAQVAENAERALAVREDKPPSQRGMTPIGIARARDLANRVALSEDTIRRMVAYFERHVSDKDGETWSDQGKGWQAWYGWGGDEGWEWAKRKRDEFDRARGAKSAPCNCKRTATELQANCNCKRHAKHWSARDAWLGDSLTNRDPNSLFTKAKRDTGELVDDAALRKLAEEVDAVFGRQVDEIVAAIRAEGTPTPATIDRVMEAISKREWSVSLRQAFGPYLEESLRHGAELGMATLSKLTGDVSVARLGWTSAELDEYVARTSTVLSTRATTGLNTTRTEAVSDLLGRGLQDGDTVDELAQRVQDWAQPQGDERAETWRAVRVARTEAAYAASTAEQAAWRSTGLVKGKTWLLAPDPCEFCEAASKAFGKTGVSLDDPFYPKGSVITGADGGTYKADYEQIQGPPLHPNCRCATQPVLNPEYEDLAAEAERRISAL